MAKSICSVPVCERHVHGGGLCAQHYLWSRKHGGATPTHAIGTIRPVDVTPCIVEVCDRPRGWGPYCFSHRMWIELNPGRVPTHAIGKSWRSGGAAGALARHTRSDEASDCVNWTGALSKDGYGVVNVRHGANKAHRLAWLVAYGSLPATPLELDHTCGNRACVNVAHLEPVTHEENIRRAQVSGSYVANGRSR
jgi:hypothetical protein